MDFDSVMDRAILTVDEERYLIVTVKELSDWRSVAIFDFETGRIAAEVERHGPKGRPHHVLMPLDDLAVYIGNDIEEAIIQLTETE
ncbi:hypothetical protein [Actinomadura alba]|uniref:Uncharacterized protein n=1 Tax=Actinomadura alba TaxID=406431 RepID=A0ABR7LTR6_9ACTN|nr:hypothetical protein [Actinomadura alba]MBC6468244.1 hypothetical protein [Actinomadura alba]